MYIATRVRAAGGDASRIFTREAVTLIHQRSGGIPRTINVICDNALVTGFGLERRLIDREIVADVVRDFDLEASAVNSAKPEPDSSDEPAREDPITSAPATMMNGTSMRVARGRCFPHSAAAD